MTAANAYRAFTVSYKAVSLLGITDVSISDAGQAVDLMTDASPTVTAVFVDAIATEVTITSTDIGGASAWHPGDTGSLTIVFQQRAEGKAAGGTNKTATCGNATMISATPKAGTNGVGQVELVIRCSGPAGTTPLVWS